MTYSFANGLRIDWMAYKPPDIAAKLHTVIDEVCGAVEEAMPTQYDDAVAAKRQAYEKASAGVDSNQLLTLCVVITCHII